MSNVSRGNYYKKRSLEWFKKRGYNCELLEINYTLRAPGRVIYKKFDPIGSDGVAWNEHEFILWNAKSTITGSISSVKSSGKRDYKDYKFPNFIKKQLIIWKPRDREPSIVEVS